MWQKECGNYMIQKTLDFIYEIPKIQQNMEKNIEKYHKTIR